MFGNNLTLEQLLAGKAVMELEPGIRVEGTVEGHDGKPLDDAIVALLRRTTMTASASTARDGRFQMILTNETDHALLVEAVGHAPFVQDVPLQRDMEPLKIALLKGRTLRGRVLGDDDKPVPGASVRVVSWNQPVALSWSATTDAQGRFAWTSAPEDSVQLSISKDGLKTLRTSDLVAGEEESVFRMGSGFWVTGRVTDADTKEPVPQFTIIKGSVYSSGEPPYWDVTTARLDTMATTLSRRRTKDRSGCNCWPKRRAIFRWYPRSSAPKAASKWISPSRRAKAPRARCSRRKANR